MMIKRRYSDDELHMLADLINDRRQLLPAHLAKKLVEDGLIRETSFGTWAITEAGCRVIGEV